ncbi:fluoride efflux transporter CrcB [Pontibaca methylaminivorans]|uniref:Fluoride-specific ion channel FluC n=1 Tax=Pontibaca methylaminivorans TaxID=515897 RepID=A0A1R3WLZ9_9RHOB|nr:camphor resistance protein CrcB [Pontibaca methylaminivorans]
MRRPRDILAMMISLASVALGGAVGAMLRYLAGVAVFRLTGPQDFPLAVMGVNILGSFLMGVFVVLAAQRGLTHLGPLVAVGLLGGFTTFSSFSLETITLIERGALFEAMAYVLLSVGLSLGALALGLVLSRGVLS